MPIDATLLAVGVEGRGIKETDRDLASLAQTAERSEKAADAQGAAWKRSSDILTRQNAVMSESLRGQAESMQALSDATQRVLARYDPLGVKLRSLQADFARLNQEVAKGAGGGQEGAIDKTYAALNAEIAKTKGLMEQAGAAGAEGFGKAEKGAVAAALSTARARQELIVLGHEAMTGNFSRMPGSFVVLGEQVARAGVHILGVAGIVAGAAAVVGLFLKAMHDGALEVEQFNQAIFRGGNFAGTSVGQMRELAREIAATGDVSLSAGKQIIEGLVGSGKIGQESLKAIAALTADWVRATGADAAKVGEQLGKVFEDPAKGAEKLNESMHFLSVADLRYITELEQMGRIEEARLVLAERLRGQLDAAPAQLGFLERAWNGVKGAAASAWDAMLGLGRATSPEEALNAQIATVSALQNKLDEQTSRGRAPGNTQERLDAARALLGSMLDEYGAQQNVNKATGEAAQKNRELAEINRIVQASTLGRVEAIDNEIARLKAEGEAYVANGGDAKQLAGAIADLQRQRESLLNKGFHVDANDGALAAAAKVLRDAQRAADEFGQTVDAKTSPAMKHLIDLLGDPAFIKLSATTKAAIQDMLLDADAVEHDTAARKQLDAEIHGLINSYGALSASLDKQQSALDQQLASLEKYGNSTEHQTEAATEWELENGKLGATILALSLGGAGFVDVLRTMAIAQAQQVDRTRQAVQAMKDWDAERKRDEDGLRKEQAAIEDQIAKLDLQAAALRGTKVDLDAYKVAQIDAAIATQEAALAATQQDASLTGDRAAIEAKIEQLKRLKGAQQNVLDAQQFADARKGWEDLWKTAEQAGANFITDFVEHGSSAFKRLWDDFKHWAIEALAKIAAQQIVLSIGGQLPGAAGAAASVVGSGSGGGIGNIVSMFGGSGGGALAGIGGYLSSLGGALGAFGSTLGAGFSAGIATLSIAAEAGTAAIGGIASAMGAMAAVAIPVVGWIAAIGIALYAAFGQKGGGPKAGGFASSGDGVVIGGDNNRFFTPSQSDLEIKKATDQLLASYNGIVQALGGTSGKGGFALGFDTDPQGTADNRVSSGAFVNGQQVYGARDVSVGRDDKQLQEALALEGKRVVLAALQASDLPDYLSKLLNSVKVDTASSDDIDKVLATAQALKLAVTAFGQLGDQFSKLDPDQVSAVLNAFGGVDTFAKALQFLQDNFKTTADRTAETAAQLGDAFTQLGYAVPTDHKAFLDLLASLDLTTDAGRTAYASITALAPAFIAVHGTADAAAQALEQQAEANRKLVASAQDFFNQNFFSAQEQDAQRLSSDWDKVHGAWTDLGVQLLALGQDHIPTSIAGFRSLIESIDTSTDAGKALYDALIVLAPTIFDLNKNVDGLSNSAGKAADAIGRVIKELQDAATQAASQFQDIMSSIDSLSNDDHVGNFGDKLSLKLKLLQEQTVKYADLLNKEKSGSNPYGALAGEYERILLALGATSQQAAKDLAAFTVLSAQYGDAIAEQLVGLEDWYAQQQLLLAGNADALAALKTIFDQKWQDILNGVSKGVDGAVDQLAKLKQSILDYVKSLKQSDLSPASPMVKFLQAQKNYQDLLTKAQGGDLEALNKITGASDEYLRLARTLFASSPQYNAIFDAIVKQLEALGTMQKQGAGPDIHLDPNERITPPPVLLTPGSAINAPASTGDIQSLGKAMNDTLLEVLEAIRDGKPTDKLVNALRERNSAPFRKQAVL